MADSIPLSALESSGAAKFAEYGDKYSGTITAIDHRQQTDPKDGTPKFFASGDPMMLYVITVQPREGDAVALWAKGGTFDAVDGSGNGMLAAIADAVRRAGGEALEVGGELAVAYTGVSEAKPGMNPAKLYTAQYQVPRRAVAVDDLFST